MNPVITIVITRTDPITKKETVEGMQLQTTKKTMYLHKTTHLDRQSHAP